MFRQLGNLIEHHPVVVIIIIMIITAGFASLLPTLNLNTNTEEFLPDDPVVEANSRVNEYFGQNSETLMLLATADRSSSIITPSVLKSQYQLAKDIQKAHPYYVNSSISLSFFIDLMCQVEYGKDILNCTDQQIQNAYDDIRTEGQTDIQQMLPTSDPNEDIDYNPPGLFTKKQSLDSMDIKNYYIAKNETTYQFIIEVYDLNSLTLDRVQPPHRRINVMEWYIQFNNNIIPDEALNMTYTVAAHLEPTHPYWIVGNGVLTNFQLLISNLLQRQLGTYNLTTTLWIQPAGLDYGIPLTLEEADIALDHSSDRITLTIPTTTLQSYGISPSFQSMSLPAKLGNTHAGVRTYQTPLFNLPGGHISYNTTSLLTMLTKAPNIPLIGPLSERLLQKQANMSWEDINSLIEMLQTTEMIPEQLALKDIQDLWIETDTTDTPDTTYYIKPYTIDQLDLTIQALLGTKQKNNQPQQSLILIDLNTTIKQDQLADTSHLIHETIKKLDRQEPLYSIQTTGSGILSWEINDLTEDANDIIIPAIFVIICLILLIMFKRLSYMVLPLIGLTIAIIWVFGTMVLLDITFNVMAVAIVPLLMGLGVDYSVHLYHNYQSELRSGKNPAEAIKSSIQDIGVSMSLATLTTVIAFLSFLSATIPPLRDFGVLCALGIFYTLITTITLQAAIRYLLDKNKTFHFKTNQRFSLNRGMKGISSFVLEHPKLILIIGLIVTAGMATAGANVKTTFNMMDFLPEGNEAMDLLINIEEIFPASTQYQEYILLEGTVGTAKAFKGIYQTHQNLEDNDYLINNPDGSLKTTSIYTILLDEINKNISITTDYNLNSQNLPRTDSEAQALLDYLYTLNPLDMMQHLHYTDDTYDAAVIRIYYNFPADDIENDDSTARMGELYTQLNQDLESYGSGVTATVTGGSSSTYTIITNLTSSQLLSTLISIIVAALVLIIVYRSPSLGIIAILPVTISLLWIIGSMYFIGYSFNIMTIMVTSLTIGIGIDYAIHATGRFRLTASRTGSLYRAVRETVSHTGAALFIAALTTAAGFGILILAPMPPEQQFGVITALVIIYSYLTTIFILPPILQFWGKRKQRSRGYIISPFEEKEKKKD